MASEDETFDPNDLDSIDALLDEAEQEVAENREEEPPKDEAVDETPPEVPPAEESELAMESDENLDDLLDDVQKHSGQQAVPQQQKTPAEEPPVSRFQEASTGRQSGTEDDTEDFLSKRAAAQNQSNNGLSAAEMEALKKLIIIFSSVLIVLVLVAIGIGIWGGLSSGGLDEESKAAIEDIRSGTEQNTLASSSNNQSMQSIEKKLDALSFQIEQLTTDIVALEGPAGKKMAGIVQQTPKTESVKEVQQDAVKPVQTVSAQPSRVVVDKLNSVHSKVGAAQRRIYEVNQRVKKLQGQYSQLLHSLKKVEKQMLEQVKKTAEKEKEKQKQSEESEDYPFYNQGGLGSYP